jgi:hypothetical protein
MVLVAAIANAQQLTGTLTGTVYDQTGSVIPNADITMKNEASGDTRHSVSNSSGYFTFSAVQPGSYTVSITANGFKTWQQHEIAFSQGDNRKLPNVNLEIGATTQNVEVVTSAGAVAPVDTGEVATTLNAQMVNDLTLQGRDAGELLKIMPGMAFSNGLTQGSSFSDRVVSSNGGPVGAYSANGQQPNGSMAFMLDGANLVDPGNMGTQIANINQDMTAEVKVLMSGYDAAYAKGPVVFQAFSKSGGAQFHGEGYLYARNNVFNSEDSYQRSQGVKKADAYEYYPGGNIGGPVVLPFTHYNRDHNKLFFWFGYEYMRQQPAGTLWTTFVPTAQMRTGDFSPAALQAAGLTGNGNASSINSSPCPAVNPAVGCKNSGLVFNNGQIPSNLLDPNALALLKTYPQPNVDPGSHNGYNYQYLDQSAQNRWEQTEKIDWAPSDSTKVTFSYARQDETDIHPVQVWWAPAFSLPYPSSLVAPTTANVTMANVTHVFSPTLTNETVFTYARYINPLTPSDPKAIDPATYGFSVPGLFGANRVQIPNVISWSANNYFAGYDQQGVFGGTYHGGAFGGTKSDPAIYDNLSKVAGTHTMKFGFYWDTNGNIQSNGNTYNGTYDFEPYGNTTTGNLYADLLTGRAQSYTQGSIQTVDDIKYHQWSLYAQDSWKATRRLTLNYGLRADHVGQWYDGFKQGAAVFDLGAYAKDPTAVNAGLQWHATDSSIPISGFKSPLFYYEPRVGAAFDIFGDGKTVLRGGFAMFRYQLGVGSTSGAAQIPVGVINYGTPTGLTSLDQITSFTLPTGTNAACGNTCSVSPLVKGDGKTPYTENYNVSLTRSLGWQSTMEVSYVGNRSRDLLIAGTNADFYNINMVPLGAFYKPDPVTGVVNPIYNIPNTNEYRPLQSYGDIWLAGHGSYANYNSLQASVQKQSGPLTFLVNYTFGKVMGIREWFSGNGASDGVTVDPFNIKNNYGVLGYNHTHIFNAAYVWNLPKPIHNNWILSGVVNGWQLSGTTSFQTGAPIQPNTNGTLNASFGNVTYGTDSSGNTIKAGVGPQTWLGSNAKSLMLVPVLTCDPGKNLKSGYYFNPNCFGVPAQGTNGTLVWPNIHGPAYFNSDLALSKNFRVTEHQSLQLRFSAFNFLNHPNPEFNADGGNTDLALNFGAGGQNNLLTQTNQSTTTTGKPAHTVGDRLVEFAIKYYF